MTHDSARTCGIRGFGPIGETQRLTAAKVQEVVQRAQQTGGEQYARHQHLEDSFASSAAGLEVCHRPLSSNG